MVVGSRQNPPFLESGRFAMISDAAMFRRGVFVSESKRRFSAPLVSLSHVRLPDRPWADGEQSKWKETQCNPILQGKLGGGGRLRNPNVQMFPIQRVRTAPFHVQLCLCWFCNAAPSRTMNIGKHDCSMHFLSKIHV